MRYIIIIIIALATTQSTCAQKISVGAIRWDAWYGNGLAKTFTAGREVERALGPNKYHYRAPFFSKIIGKDSIQCRETTQSVMDQDISYAHYAGIDYWAFCWYPDTNGLGLARKLYLNSKYKSQVKWCLIWGTDKFDMNNDARWLIKEFKKTYYQKVLNNRPLVYIYGNTNRITSVELNALRTMARQNNIDPYFVLMLNNGKNNALSINDVDAISQYNSYAGGNGKPYYPAIPNEDKRGWNAYANTGKQVIPWVTTGRNQKPRIDHQVSWQKIDASGWTADATTEQIIGHLNNASNWVKQNNSISKANTVIVYAWNEFDEGGWLCPTVGPDSSRIKALRKFLRK